MHNNFFFLQPLTRELEKRIRGFTLVSCFSQNKDELVIEFNNGLQSFFIKASLQSDFSCLSFPATFTRARKNSVDLFIPLLMKKITGAYQFRNERSFLLKLGEGHSLLFKMHGNRANIIRLEGDSPRELFRNHLKTDLELAIRELDRDIDWSKEHFPANWHDLFNVYFTLGKEVKIYLEHRGYNDLSPSQQWTELQHTLTALVDHPEYFIVEHRQRLHFSLLPFGAVKKKFTDPIEAINEFFLSYVQTSSFDKEKTVAVQRLNEQIKNGSAYVEKTQRKLNELATDVHWQVWGDLVMANLHRIKTGEVKVTLQNFYNNDLPVDIPLKRELSPQKNAEVFYRKSKNSLIEISKLKESLQKKESELAQAKKRLNEITTAHSFTELRARSQNLSTEKAVPIKKQPFHEFVFQGFKIWVGKDAQSNDELTLKYSYKEDLWLHAKDVAGSHVIIKHQAGKNYPKEVVVRAAELAAYNSKRKNESLCPVSVTSKKFVRKRKGDPPGAVVVEREHVMMVEPKL